MKIITKTDRLKIRELNLTDKNSLFKIYSNKEAMKYRVSKPFDSLEEVDEMLINTFKKLDSKEEFRYAIEQKENKVLIGTFLIKPISENECEIGYSIGKKYWGNGYGKELVEGMLVYIKDLSFNKIIAITRKENIASLKLLESIEFKVFPEKAINGCHFLEYSLE